MKFIHPRSWWGAMLPMREIEPLHLPVKYVYFSYTKGDYVFSDTFAEQELLRLQARHMSAGASDIVYNFLIAGNGRIFEGRGWYKRPKLAKRFQDIYSKSVLIAYMGIFKGSVPYEKMMLAGDWLIKHGVYKGLIDPHFVEYRVAGCGYQRNSYLMNGSKPQQKLPY